MSKKRPGSGELFPTDEPIPPAAMIGRDGDVDAIAADGALLVVERELGAPNENPDAKLSDLNMMVGPGGRERTREEFAALFAETGFELQRVVPTAIGLTVFEAHAS